MSEITATTIAATTTIRTPWRRKATSVSKMPDAASWGMTLVGSALR